MHPRSLSLREASCRLPEYPRAAVLADAQGVTRVEFVVNAAGEVTNIRIIKASGATPVHALLDKAVVESVASCRFPAASGFGPVTARQEFQWKLE